MNELTTGQRIAACRKELGISQEALGEKLGVSRQAISKWEADGAMPEIDKLIGLSRLFHVSVGWLLGVEEAAAPESEARAEVSEELLRKIEEVVLRYRPGKQPLTGRRKAILGLCVVLALWCSISFAGKWSRLTLDVAATGSQVRNNNEQNARIMEKLSDLEARMESPANSLLSHYQFRIVPIHIESAADTSDAEIHFSAVPARWQEGDTGILSIHHPDRGNLQVRCDWDGAFLTAMLPLGADSGYMPCFTVCHADGTREQQLLEDTSVENLRSSLSLPVHVSRGDGVVRPDGPDLKLVLRDYAVYVERPGIARLGDTWDTIEYVLYLDRSGKQEIVGTYDLLGAVDEEDEIRYSNTIESHHDSAEFILPGALEGDGLELWLRLRMSNGMEGLTLVDQWRYSGGSYDPVDVTIESE